MSQIDITDSYVAYVKQRIEAFNTQRIVQGVMQAQDWPPQEVLFDTFYFLILSDSPSRMIQSISAPRYATIGQWVWIIKGTDIAPGTVSANRGDRYRTHRQMMQELIYGNFPYSTDVSKWGTDATGVLVSTPYVDKATVQQVIWTFPDFRERTDKNSGLIYGSATVELGAFADQVLQ